MEMAILDSSDPLVLLNVERHIVGNRILHTHETGVCEVARMVEMSVCEAARIVARKFTMGIGYDRMVALGMWFHRMVALGIGYNSGNCDGTVNLNSRKMVGYLLEIVDQLDYLGSSLSLLVLETIVSIA
ncbi:hypothetical protein Tco_0955607 [Tanacetum coccineum]|uniref:Uncharacterized protein n=1 Tax=Tanacetum coccineum TaxID=301880 RepID=A0ABQ5E7R0_9ASTR